VKAESNDTMGLSTAERNRQKRERKKKEKELRRKQDKEESEKKEEKKEEEVEIEYVSEPVAVDGMEDVMQKFQERAAVVTSVVTDDEVKGAVADDDDEDEDEDEATNNYSKRQLRQTLRPSVAVLKRRVRRADLVEAHDITAPDPDFLICLKGLPGTVPVPRHWGRKRKYLQGKRGFEKPPFQLPDFILKTGIADLRDTVSENEAGKSAKQTNRGRVAPKMGAMDVDYRTLHEAFFQHQTKPTDLTRQGDLYYEGKEMETRNRVQPGKPLSEKLREALGMTAENMPPPWLVNMQRYGPPPSYPSLKVHGLNAPLPSTDCQYGYHMGGWGKPPVDNYGRPLYGGNPFDPPGDGAEGAVPKEGLVTSDGKTLASQEWGSLPMGEDEAGSDDDDDDEEMDESSDEEDEGEEQKEEGEEPTGEESVVPLITKAAPTELRKGIETPVIESAVQKQLYTVLEERKTTQGQQVFGSEVQYVVPGGAESVLSKAAEEPSKKKKKRSADDDQDEGLDKNFKF
jgi:splicing factor 3B subunit 2